MEPQNAQANNNLPFFSAAQLSFLFFSFDGRIGREKYLMGLATLFVFLIALNFILSIIPAIPAIPILTTIIFFLLWLSIGLSLMVGSFAVIIKRLHDLNQSGWWALLLFIPVPNILMILYLAVAPTKVLIP